VPPFDDHRVARLYKAAKADRWDLPIARFHEALEASVSRAFSGRSPTSREVDGYLDSLYIEDLALASACVAGCRAAWDHFVLQYRPVLYRSAEAIDPTGAARELADSLYADLYGLDDDHERRSLFRYFHGRSSLATWLRSVLAQRWVDLLRTRKRIDPLPDDLPIALGASSIPDPDAARYGPVLQEALEEAVSRLESRDALRLRLYYQQRLTLAEIGRMLREHEATVSRQLARTRKSIRGDAEDALRQRGLGDDEITRCLELALEDSGALDLERIFSSAAERKKIDPDRSE
jgi:RNA polymerase sigma factor (sigma-70 family)